MSNPGAGDSGDQNPGPTGSYEAGAASSSLVETSVSDEGVGMPTPGAATAAESVSGSEDQNLAKKEEEEEGSAVKSSSSIPSSEEEEKEKKGVQPEGSDKGLLGAAAAATAGSVGTSGDEEASAHSTPAQGSDPDPDLAPGTKETGEPSSASADVSAGPAAAASDPAAASEAAEGEGGSLIGVAAGSLAAAEKVGPGADAAGVEGGSSAGSSAGSAGAPSSAGGRVSTVGGRSGTGQGQLRGPGAGGAGPGGDGPRELQLDPQRVFVGGIPWSMLAEEAKVELKALCCQHGKVEEIEMCTYRGQSKASIARGKHRGFGFVRMSSCEEAKVVIEALDGVKMGETTLRTKPGVVKTGPFPSRREKSMPATTAATAMAATPPPPPPPPPSAAAAVTTPVERAPQRMRRPRGGGGGGGAPYTAHSQPPPPTSASSRKHVKMFVGNLSRTVTKEVLLETFQQVGPVVDLKIVKDRMTGESRGFAFVTFGNEEAAVKAMEKDGFQVDGCIIRVSPARR
ncbi:hypothetical protein CBR_g28065 [Chara braunii]|uniref:RRM domain-containing protein n=1 Tax=Chara braunii TaxID=69332 RepID=A0A388L954_CHABU|nr:hypothetical protein CBR_g28065 [Chara braunii]|eukprot:GBG78841.1 hypothetical protein CBR_g28065 [Chara braunii]